MKANELRVGNIILREGFEIEVIGWNISEAESSNTDLQPIPLTEEWLLRFGFEWRGLGGKYLTLFTPCGKALVYIDGYVRFTNTTIETPIQHVHQLQNLFFALTGEELTIKS